ncbi:C40 family peptidase [Homoserinibacter gongjuensis]|uniref:Peptidase P60 n=1 Tax=Homoserinibacter gongjuensis TaxID=1162968 RepID=A0ABQ6JRW9_9MICO|nr:C40 family peptidase [Homoserinibacter gongjuensis]GMA90878.1 peptidase P60 [Homoserinibacter gongjuensis]
MADRPDRPERPGGSAFRRPAGPAATAAVSIAAAFALTATGGISVAAAPGDDYPTWAEVQAAKQSESAKKAEIAKLEGLVGELQAQAAALEKVAMQKAEDALLAQNELQAAEAKTTRLSDQLADATQRAESSAKLAASLVARLARTGGSDAMNSLVFSSEADADSLLSRLGTMSKLSESSAALVEQAVFDQKAVSSLTAEAELAESERRARAEAAQQAQSDAEQAAADVETQVAAQQANQSVLYAQLASLKGTTAELERAYAEGVAAQQPQPPAGGTPGGGNGGAPGGTPGGGSSDPAPPPTPVTSAVDGAIAYAKAQLGERYQLGGMGPDAWDCSGLTKASYASVGVYIGIHSSTDQYNYMAAQGRLVPFSQALPGDLIFYSDGGSATIARKYHVAIYLGGGMMIEAPNPSAPVRIVSARAYDRVPYVGRPTG